MAAYVQSGYWVAGYAVGDEESAFEEQAPVRIQSTPPTVRLGLASSAPQFGSLGPITATIGRRPS